MATITYEKTACGRCGGSGQYSFNMMHGSRCYGCNGSGKVLTKRGRATKAKADEMFDVKIEDFAKLADRKARYVDMWTGRKTTFSKVVVVGTQKGSSLKDGVMVPYEHEVYGLLLKQEDGTFKQASTELSAGIKVRLIPTDEEIEYLIAYQDNLTKAGKLRKNATVV